MVAISIIIPVYNAEMFLHECLNSLTSQTFKDFEIICINDGSTDSSPKILEEYAKKDCRFKVYNQENQGAGAARNNGVEFAQGEYIQFLDSDDYFAPTMLEELYNKAQEFDTDITICSARKIDEKGNIIESGNPLWPYNRTKALLNKAFSWKDFPEDIFDLFNVIPWNKLYKKDLITQNNIKYQNLSSCNDITFSHITRLLAKKIVIFDRELINYRQQRNGSISENRGNSVKNILHSAAEVKNFLVEKNLYNELEKSYKQGFVNHIRAGVSYCNEEQYKIFKNDFKTLFPDLFEDFSSVLQSDYITLEHLNNFIGDKQVYLWGASNFLRKLLEKEEKPNSNIMGIIDKNEASWGKDFGNYKIYSPEILETNPASILVTVYNNNEKMHFAIKKELKEKFPEINVLDNIFGSISERKLSEKKYCPFCNKKFWFKPFGITKRLDAQCPICNSLERHRFLYYIYKLFIPKNKNIKLLHMAPEKAISNMFLNKKNVDYICIDLYPENFPHLPNCLKMNVLDLKFPDNTFDFVISNHVIEHIENEEKFIEEITRVLKPDGKAIISAPCDYNLKETFEDYTITSPEERLKAFGQEDHVRKYGTDIFDRISKYAKVTPINRDAFDGFINNEISLGYCDAVMFVEKFNKN